jgi:light-regulated signal transduction histidine kinase (bacteriophytochrome)
MLSDLREYWSVNDQKIDNLGPIDCNYALEKSLGDLDVSIQESGAVVTHDSLPIVTAEAFPLTVLFQNLIGNAIKYRRPEVPPRIHISAQRRGAAWEISVTDNGIGIETKHLATIFTPFKRLHGKEYPGTGLGLAMCQKVIERYHGHIGVESKHGQGSTFRFTLPGQSA